MSISKRRLEANRRNAQKSTGPRTTAGKETVSQNHSIHGLCGRFRVLANEDQAESDDLLARFMQIEQPAGDVERELVAKMVRHTWLSRRAIQCQDACFLVQPQSPEQKEKSSHTVAVLKDMELYIRYQAAHDRAYQMAANELRNRRKERLLAARGFESQKRAEAGEKRRDRRQNQRDELHPYKVAAAELHWNRELARTAKANWAMEDPADAPTTPEIDRKRSNIAA